MKRKLGFTSKILIAQLSGVDPAFIPIIMGVDILLDMSRNTVNITGD